MVPPIFTDMLIFGCVAGPRVSGETGGSAPFRIHLLGPCQRPAFATSLAGYKLRLLLLWSGWISYATVSHFPYPSEDTLVWLFWSREKVNTASATVSKRNVGNPDHPRPASS